MNATDLLLTRQSNGALCSPAPDNAALDFILQAGMRVPDHAGLSPFHFTLVQGEDKLAQLGEVFVDCLHSHNDDIDVKNKTRAKPLRAPLIIIVTTNYQAHEKVPRDEQLITAGCSVYAMQMASYALGYGAMWRTGKLCHAEKLKAYLKVSTENDIVGFLYIGSNKALVKQKPRKHYKDYLTVL